MDAGDDIFGDLDDIQNLPGLNGQQQNPELHTFHCPYHMRRNLQGDAVTREAFLSMANSVQEAINLYCANEPAFIGPIPHLTDAFRQNLEQFLMGQLQLQQNPPHNVNLQPVINNAPEQPVINNAQDQPVINNAQDQPVVNNPGQVQVLNNEQTLPVNMQNQVLNNEQQIVPALPVQADRPQRARRPPPRLSDRDHRNPMDYKFV